MKRARVLLVGVLLAVPVIGASPAHACVGRVCDAINRVCDAVADPCLP